MTWTFTIDFRTLTNTTVQVLCRTIKPGWTWMNSTRQAELLYRFEFHFWPSQFRERGSIENLILSYISHLLLASKFYWPLLDSGILTEGEGSEQLTSWY